MPEKTELTRAKIEAIKPPASGDRTVYDVDERRLGVRVTSKGSKTFVLYRRVSGKPVRLTLPRWTRCW